MCKYKTKKAFSLVELIVVIAIISILAAIALPSIFEAIEKSRISRAKADTLALKNAAIAYYADMGFLPPDVNRGEDPGLFKLTATNSTNSSLTAEQKSKLSANWNGPYIDKWPDKTPWGGKYDWQSWRVSTTRGNATVDAGCYVSIVSTASGNPEGTVPPKAQVQLVNEGFDSDGSSGNNEVLHLLIKDIDLK